MGDPSVKAYSMENDSLDPGSGSYADESWMDTPLNNGIREITIIILAGAILAIGAYLFLVYLRLKGEGINGDTIDGDLSRSQYENNTLITSNYSYKVPIKRAASAIIGWDEDEVVYKISFAICIFSLAVSAGSVLLLPISSISNEVLHRYPKSWYIKWLNASLIYGIWNLIFVLSNLSLFILLPFAYLFCESEGFFGYKKGLIARAKETMLTLLLLSLIILGMMYIMAALLDWDQDSLERIVNLYSYLPMLYSWMSFLGVLLLLLCTPLGFARLFTIVGELVVSPISAKNLDDEYLTLAYEEDCKNQKLDSYLQKQLSSNTNINDETLGSISSSDRFSAISPSDINQRATGSFYRKQKNRDQFSIYQEVKELKKEIKDINERKQKVEVLRKRSMWRRTIGYPLIMVFITVLTAASIGSVVKNVGQIVAGFKSLPAANQQTVTLGISSLTSFGVVGVVIEVVLIAFLFVCSLVGLYTIPGIRCIRPIAHETTLTQIILNCGLYVILSSALPLLAKILGITNFDLLGSFGKMKWLGNFYIVLLYNAIFACSASLSLFNKLTSRVRQEIISRLSSHFSRLFAWR